MPQERKGRESRQRIFPLEIFGHCLCELSWQGIAPLERKQRCVDAVRRQKCTEAKQIECHPSAFHFAKRLKRLDEGGVDSIGIVTLCSRRSWPFDKLPN